MTSLNLTPAPSVSVCLASYNGARHIKSQIDSILIQLKPGDELLVSDDGSIDGTLDILRSYGDRLRLVSSLRAGGVVKNFERVLAAARGDFVVLCDQDDIWLEKRIDLIRERLQSATTIMSNGSVVNEDLQPVGQDVWAFVKFHSGFFRTFVSTRYVGCCMAFRRELLEVALPFPSRIQWHDWYLALVSELLFTCSHDSKVTILYRRHENNASNTGQRSSSTLWQKIVARFWMARAVIIALLRKVRNQMSE